MARHARYRHTVSKHRVLQNVRSGILLAPSARDACGRHAAYDRGYRSREPVANDRIPSARAAQFVLKRRGCQCRHRWNERHALFAALSRPYFSILLQARCLVTHGPYAHIHHPLYLVETIAILGLTLSYRQPWAGLIFLASFVVQLVRINFEEDVLTRVFPEYAAYKCRTYRRIPGLY